MLITLRRGGVRGVARHGGRAWRHDDRGIRMTFGNCVVDVVSVVRAVTRKGVAWRAWHLSPRHQHVRLAFPLPSKSHPPPAVLVRQPTNQIRADFVNGLLSGRPRESLARSYWCCKEAGRSGLIRSVYIRLSTNPGSSRIG